MEPLLLPCKANMKTFVWRSAFTVHCNTGHVQLTDHWQCHRGGPPVVICICVVDWRHTLTPDSPIFTCLPSATSNLPDSPGSGIDWLFKYLVCAECLGQLQYSGLISTASDNALKHKQQTIISKMVIIVSQKLTFWIRNLSIMRLQWWEDFPLCCDMQLLMSSSSCSQYFIF